MQDSEIENKKELELIPQADQKKGIEHHKNAATHFEAAAKSHLDAAKHHEVGDHEKAAKSTVEAHGHSVKAHEAQKEDVKHHSSNE